MRFHQEDFSAWFDDEFDGEIEDSGFYELAKRLWEVAKVEYEKCLSDPDYHSTLFVPTEKIERMLRDQLCHHHGVHLDEMEDDPDLSAEKVKEWRQHLDFARERIKIVLIAKSDTFEA